jgi:hypothetical protein
MRPGVLSPARRTGHSIPWRCPGVSIDGGASPAAPGAPCRAAAGISRSERAARDATPPAALTRSTARVQARIDRALSAPPEGGATRTTCARGLQVGSGTLERAWKHLVSARLTLAGMIWDVPGAEAVAVSSAPGGNATAGTTRCACARHPSAATGARRQQPQQPDNSCLDSAHGGVTSRRYCWRIVPVQAACAISVTTAVRHHGRHPGARALNAAPEASACHGGSLPGACCTRGWRWCRAAPIAPRRRRRWRRPCVAVPEMG